MSLVVSLQKHMFVLTVRKKKHLRCSQLTGKISRDAISDKFSLFGYLRLAHRRRSGVRAVGRVVGDLQI